MARRLQEAIPAEIESLANRFDVYRRSRRRQRCLPESLWTQAAELARKHGAWRVQRALRLNYADLKRRAEALPSPANGSARPAFVEVNAPPSWASAPPCRSRSSKSCADISPAFAGAAAILELEDRTGRKLTVRLAGESGVDRLAALARALWDSPR